MVSKSVIMRADMAVNALRRWQEAVDKLSPKIVMNIIKSGMLDPEDKATLEWYGEQRISLIKSLNRSIREIKDGGLEYRIPADLDLSCAVEPVISLCIISEEDYDDDDLDDAETEYEDDDYIDWNDINA